MNDIQKTLISREKTHGDYETQSLVSQRIKSIILERLNHPDVNTPHSGFLEAVDMICLKLARIACGNYKEPDHWHDIAGYALLAERIAISLDSKE